METCFGDALGYPLRHWYCAKQGTNAARGPRYAAPRRKREGNGFEAQAQYRHAAHALVLMFPALLRYPLAQPLVVGDLWFQ